MKSYKTLQAMARKTTTFQRKINGMGVAQGELPTMPDVDRISALFEAENTPHSIVRVNDYIALLKSDGYRCGHIVLEYTGGGEDECYNRQNVEVQLRAHLQYAWVTAVEAVGLMRDENLEGGQGLLFFAIISPVIAENEGLPSVNVGEADGSIRIKELAGINKRQQALVQLESCNQAIRHNEEWWTGSYRYFVMNFNQFTRTVTISPHVGFRDLSDAYAREEGWLTASSSNAVVVEVDRVGDLKSAYPNYYLDVQAFRRECESALAPPPKGQNLPSLGLQGADLSFLTGWQHWRRRRGV